MERVNSFKDLTAGQKIVRVFNGDVFRYEFVCLHPRSKEFAIFIDNMGNTVPTFNEDRLKNEEWLLYTESLEERMNIHDIQMRQKREIELNKTKKR